MGTAVETVLLAVILDGWNHTHGRAGIVGIEVPHGSYELVTNVIAQRRVQCVVVPNGVGISLINSQNPVVWPHEHRNSDEIRVLHDPGCILYSSSVPEKRIRKIVFRTWIYTAQTFTQKASITMMQVTMSAPRLTSVREVPPATS